MDGVQVKIEEQRMEQTVHQTIRSQEKNPGNLVRSVTSIRLGVDAERADEQDAEEGLADTLKEIVKRTVPSPLYAKYHEQHLQRFLSRLGAYTPRYASYLLGSRIQPSVLMSCPSQAAVLHDVTCNLAAKGGLDVCAACVSKTVSTHDYVTLPRLQTPVMSDIYST